MLKKKATKRGVGGKKTRRCVDVITIRDIDVFPRNIADLTQHSLKLIVKVI